MMKELSFISIDVETANPNMASICQIGVAIVENSVVVDQWQTLVDPQDYFHPGCVAVHGIEARDVVGAPAFAEVAPKLIELMRGRVVVSHSRFDQTAVYRAMAAVGRELEDVRWLDSAMVVRRTWGQFAKAGYGLANVADFLGISFRHHDALEDARTAAQVVIRAAVESGSDLPALMQLVRPLPYKSVKAAAPAPNEDGPLFGERLVFTGSLAIPRAEAKAMAAELGCDVSGGVNRKTTLLVVGDQDVSRLAGKDKSEKHRKAEELIGKGLPIRILGESDFFAMLEEEAVA